MSLRKLSLAVGSVVFLAIGGAYGATLTLTGPGPSPNFVTFTGGTVTSTVIGQQIGGDMIKISGNAEFIQTASPVSEITMTVSGTFSVSRGDSFVLDYEFSAALNSINPMAYTLQVDVAVNLGFGSFPINDVVSDEDTFDPGNSFKTAYDAEEIGDDIFDLIGSSTITGSFTARLILNTSTLATGESVSLTIPSNSIDLYAGVIPEPSGVILSSVGLLGLSMRRRR